jgi:hypothetical protein
MSAYYGPVVPVRTQARLLPWFILGVVVLGVLDDRGVIHITSPKPPARTAPASTAAKADIPRAYLATYQRAARACPGLPWAVLAGIGKVETNHGRAQLPGVRSGVNAFGCCAGPMQFNIRNGPPSTWDAYGRGGNVYDYRDAIPAAALLLCRNGARGGRDLRGAIFAYNHAGWYVDQVLANARRYQARSR